MTRSNEQVLLRLLSISTEQSPCKHSREEDEEEAASLFFYADRFLCKTRLTLYFEQNDRSRLLVAFSLVDLSITQRESIFVYFRKVLGVRAVRG